MYDTPGKIANSTVNGNIAPVGGGIYADSSIVIDNCISSLISHNFSSFRAL